MENRSWIIISVFFTFYFHSTLQEHRFAKSTPSLKQFLLNRNLPPNHYWLACQDVRSWITVTSATTIDGDHVETHPNWRDFEVVHCANEDVTCSGIDLNVFQSTCKTSVSYQPAMVRRIGVDEEFDMKLIMLPGSCSCWVVNDKDRQQYDVVPGA